MVAEKLLSRQTKVSPGANDWKPVLVREIDIGRPLPDFPAVDAATGQRYERAVALVRLHTRPLGKMDLRLGEAGLSAAECAHQIWLNLSQEITHHLQQDGLPTQTLDAKGLSSSSTPLCVNARDRFLAHAPFVSVVVATHNRPAGLAACLDSLLELNYPRFEIIVVDNAPSAGHSADWVCQAYGDHVHYVREDRPGLALAHNRGLMEVRAPIVAFTDDDVTVDRHWLAELASGFDATENVACVTGMILAAELQTPAQVWIEQFGYSKGFARQVFDLQKNRPRSPLYPYAAGVFGSGANMAFKTSALSAMGGFDPALGAGSVAKGGDDLAAFFQVITQGYRLVYEPGAILYHWHHRDYASLCRQAYGYGLGLTAYLMSALVSRPASAIDLAIRMPFGLLHAFRLRSSRNTKQQADYPRELVSLERKGMLYGPWAYIRSRWRCRQGKYQASRSKVSLEPASHAYIGDEAPQL